MALHPDYQYNKKHLNDDGDDFENLDHEVKRFGTEKVSHHNENAVMKTSTSNFNNANTFS